MYMTCTCCPSMNHCLSVLAISECALDWNGSHPLPSPLTPLEKSDSAILALAVPHALALATMNGVQNSHFATGLRSTLGCPFEILLQIDALCTSHGCCNRALHCTVNAFMHKAQHAFKHCSSALVHCLRICTQHTPKLLFRPRHPDPFLCKSNHAQASPSRRWSAELEDI